ncbi:MAG: hypothetical protein AB4041_08360 [Microcystaceae cyanobacterium]
MNYLSTDDLPPTQVDTFDRELRQQLDDVTTYYFDERCDAQTKALLSLCEWYITSHGNALTLVIICPNSMINWRVLNSMNTLANLLESLAESARIKVYSPSQQEEPIEMRVDERMVYGDR